MALEKTTGISFLGLGYGVGLLVNDLSCNFEALNSLPWQLWKSFEEGSHYCHQFCIVLLALEHNSFSANGLCQKSVIMAHS